ncbi:MAG TPA: site-specific integrase [Allocoleopsis sp.]
MKSDDQQRNFNTLTPIHRKIMAFRCSISMKINRHGKAKILTPHEIRQLFEVGLTNSRDKALFGVCFYTGCRIAEVCSLQTNDIYGPAGVQSRLTLRKGNIKGKRSTRSIPVRAELAALLAAHQSNAGKFMSSPTTGEEGTFTRTQQEQFLGKHLRRWKLREQVPTDPVELF